MRTSTIQIAIENNTTDTLIQDWAETEYRMSNGQNVFKGSWTLEQHIEFCTKEVEKVRKEMQASKSQNAEPRFQKTNRYKSIFGVSADGDEDMLRR